MEIYKFSDFTVLRKLGNGAHGSAFLAVHHPDQKEVCLKFIPQSPDTAVTEIKTLSQLEDANIIEYYGSFFDSGMFCIVMEYAAGGSLYDVINVW